MKSVTLDTAIGSGTAEVPHGSQVPTRAIEEKDGDDRRRLINRKEIR